MAEPQAAAAPVAKARNPVDVLVAGAPRSSRVLAVLGILLIKSILLLPVVIVLVPLSVIVGIVGWFGYWIVLFTGRLPPWIRQTALIYLRQSSWATAWLLGLTDRYPWMAPGAGADAGDYDLPIDFHP